MLVEFDPIFCRLLHARYPAATVVQGDAYRLKHLLGSLMREPAAAVVSPIPKTLPGMQARASERIWLNLPPAQVWVYRKG